MPRAPDGTYTLPVIPLPPTAGGVIDPANEQGTRDDIAAALTDSLSRTGNGRMEVPMQVPDGTQAAPGYAFRTEPSTGFFREAAGTLSTTVTNVLVKKVTAALHTFLKQLLVVTGANDVKAIFRGHAGQTANLLEVQNSASAVLNGFKADGSLISSAANIQRTVILSGSGNFAKNALAKYVEVEVHGAGGGGGTAGATGAAQGSAGSGGAGGSGIRHVYLASALGASEPYSVGAGGAANTAGGNSTFRAAGANQLIAAGGGGGTAGTPASNITGIGGATIGASTAPVGVVIPGQGGGGGFAAVVNSTVRAMSGLGGMGSFGGGAEGQTQTQAGATGQRNGGGSGGAAAASQPAQPGGTGGPGVIIITEYW